MNQVVHAAGIVPAPPDAVFALLADPEGWPAWSGHDRGEAVSDGPDDQRELGSVRAFTVGRYRSVEEVVVFERPGHFGYVLRAGLPVRGYRADVRLEAAPGGATAITWHSEFRPHVPGTGPFLRRRLQGFIEQAIRGLAAHVGASVS